MKPQPRYQPRDRIGGRYLVHKALLGGMGEVYLCLDLETNLPYALKTFQQRYLTDLQQLRRAFEQEVATWVALEKHPNIVRCYWMQVLDNQPFMCLDWIAGEEGKGTDLRGWLRQGPLKLKLALEIAIDICNGLIHAQAKRPGLVHRDLKPENILIAQGGLAKITDFGLAEIAQKAGLALDLPNTDNNGRQSFVGRQGIAGTPAYMAPEQWHGEALDERTDIYALGCILFEMVSGSCPFHVALTPATPQSFQAWLRAMQNAHEYSRIPDLPATLLDSLNHLLQGCLAKGPFERPASMTDLVDKLTGIYNEHVGNILPTRPPPGTFTLADFNNRGNTYVALLHYEQALADFTRAIELDPNLALTVYNRGITYQALGQHLAALVDYSRAIELNPHYVNAYTNRGNSHLALGQNRAALADYTRAIELDPNFAIAYCNLSNVYLLLGQPTAAFVNCERAIELDPNLPQAYSNRGNAYQAVGQSALALIDYGHAIDLDPNYAQAYYNRGITYQALGQHEAAIVDYNRAIQLDPIFAQSYLNRGVTHAALGKHELALADYSRVIQLNPNYAQAYYNRGITYQALGDHATALTDYDRAIDLNSNFAVAYYNRGNCYHTMGDHIAALTDLDRTIQLDPNYTVAYFSRGAIYTALGQHKLALTNYDHAIQLDPNYAVAYSNRGITYAALRQHKLALADYNRAIQLNPNYAQAYYNRGITYQALGQYQLALPDYSRAIELNPNYAEAYLNIGSLWGNQGMHQKALSYFEKAAQLGSQQAAQNAVQARQMLGIAPILQPSPAQAAFAAFQQANSLATMQQAITRFPMLLQPDVIATIEQAITHQVPPEHRPALQQRLTWLRQIANTQPRSTP